MMPNIYLESIVFAIQMNAKFKSTFDYFSSISLKEILRLCRSI